MGNPKVMVFYLALLPALIDTARVTVVGYAELVAVTLGVLAIVFTGYVVLASRARRLFTSPRALQARQPRHRRRDGGRRRGDRGALADASDAARSGPIAGFWTRLAAQLIDLIGWAFLASLVAAGARPLAPGTFGLASALPQSLSCTDLDRAASGHHAAGRVLAEPYAALHEVVPRLPLPPRGRSHRGA